MKILLAVMMICVISGIAHAHTVFVPEGKTMKIHWAVLQAKPGKMPEMAAISARTAAKYTPNEQGSYSLYGGIDAKNPDIMRLLEIYEDEAAYQIHRNSDGFKAFITEREPILEKLTFLPECWDFSQHRSLATEAISFTRWSFIRTRKQRGITLPQSSIYLTERRQMQCLTQERSSITCPHKLS